MLFLLLSCFSRVRLCATLRTAAHQAPLSTGFSRQEYWSGLPFPSPNHTCVLSRFSRVQLWATLRTAPHQAPRSTGFSRQEPWSGLPFPSPNRNEVQLMLWVYEVSPPPLIFALYGDFPGSSDSKESACSARDPGLISGSGRSPGEGHANPLQYSCLEYPMDGGACLATVRGVTNSQTWLSD